MRIIGISIIYFGLMLLLAGATTADDASDTFTFGSRNISSSDVDATSGDITVTETNFSTTHAFKAFGELPVEYSLNVGHIDINDDVPVDLPSHLESRSLGVGVKFPAPFIEDDRYFMGLDIYPTFNTDGYTWNSGAFRIPFRTYLIYKESEEFILVGGVSVRPDYDVEAVPILGLIYKPNERLSFNFASDDPNIAYKFNEATTAVWEFNFTLEEYEVTRESQDGVVLKYQDVSTGIGLQHKFNENLQASISVGGVFNRRLEYKDDVGKVVPDASVYTEFKLTASF
jgi:hypothetical protein